MVQPLGMVKTYHIFYFVCNRPLSQVKPNPSTNIYINIVHYILHMMNCKFKKRWPKKTFRSFHWTSTRLCRENIIIVNFLSLLRQYLVWNLEKMFFSSLLLTLIFITNDTNIYLTTSRLPHVSTHVTRA